MPAIEPATLKVYQNFILQDIRDDFSQLRWTRMYNNMSKFEVIMLFNAEFYNILKQGETVFYKEDVDEACFVEDINIYNDVDSLTKMIIRGSGIAGNILGRRDTTLTMNGTVKNIVSALLNQSFISPSDTARKIPEFTYSNLDVSNTAAHNVDYQKRTSCLEIINKLLQPLNIGYRTKMDFDNKKYVFELYEGKDDNTIVFDKNFNNVKSQDWYLLDRDYKNVVYVGDTAIGTATGLARREYSVEPIKEESASVTGNRILQERQRKQGADVQMDITNETFIYLQDWTIGDIITFRNEELNTVIRQNILQIEEFYEQGKTNINIIFGDYLAIRR